MHRCIRCRPCAQRNKQVTIVHMHGHSRCGCRPRPCGKRQRCGCGKRRRCGGRLAREQACGTIFQICGDGPRIYFTSSPDSVSALVRVDNDTACDMEVVIERPGGAPVTGVVGQGQQVSFRVASMRRLQINCGGEGGICKGRYTVKLTRRMERRRCCGGTRG